MESTLTPEKLRVLRSMHAWQFTGHANSHPRREAVDDYLIVAELHGEPIPVRAMLEELAVRGFVRCTGRGETLGTWTLPTGRTIMTSWDAPHGLAGPIWVKVDIQDGDGPTVCVAEGSERPAFGRRYTLTAAGLAALESADQAAVPGTNLAGIDPLMSIADLVRHLEIADPSNVTEYRRACDRLGATLRRAVKCGDVKAPDYTDKQDARRNEPRRLYRLSAVQRILDKPRR